MSEANNSMKRKKIISDILRENRNWVDSRLSKPKPGEKVVVRITDPTQIYAETEDEIFPAEDAKIAQWTQDYNDPKRGEWHICPPFPRYDYSPLSNKDRLNETAVVTHWAIPAEGEIEGWEHRFDQINLFKTLKLEVDQEHESDVYRALMWGAAFIQKANPDDPDAQHLATILYDLQYVLDTGKPIDLTDEEYLQLIEERTEQIKKREEEAARQQAERVEENLVGGEEDAVDN